MTISLNLRNVYRFYSASQQFVPKHESVTEGDLKILKDFIGNSRKILILTGAGISTESGIPDYRSAEVGLYDRRNYKPIIHQQFCSSSEVRRRYWARNYIGWHRFSNCQPNTTHYCIKNLELIHNKVSSVVTQNVDRLHTKAGSKNVIELHGTAYEVICLTCRTTYDRYYIQDRIKEENPTFDEVTDMIRPDGDVEISTERLSEFEPPRCEKCGGILKPDIVFFGDNVPRKRVALIQEELSESDSLLILGSSLTVFSGYRIALQALEEKKNIAIVNIGPTRADSEVGLKIAAKCGDILSKIC